MLNQPSYWELHSFPATLNLYILRGLKLWVVTQYVPCGKLLSNPGSVALLADHKTPLPIRMNYSYTPLVHSHWELPKIEKNFSSIYYLPFFCLEYENVCSWQQPSFDTNRTSNNMTGRILKWLRNRDCDTIFQ